MACLRQNRVKNLNTMFFSRKTILNAIVIIHHISFAQGKVNHLVDSLKRAKKLPNGRLDLYTIDESIRSVFHILVSDHFDKIYEAK